MYSRRTFLKISGILATLLAGGYLFRNSGSIKVKHILPSVSHEKIAVSLSLSEGASKLELILAQNYSSSKIASGKFGGVEEFLPIDFSN